MDFGIAPLPMVEIGPAALIPGATVGRSRVSDLVTSAWSPMHT
jgi:hypothetical protein